MVGRRCLLAALALALTSFVAEPTFAQSNGADKAEWQSHYRTLLDDVAKANMEYEDARRAYNKNRQLNRKRGEKRAELNETLRAAQVAKVTAEAELADFPDLARRAGVPPGWLREVEDSAPPARPTESPGS